MPPFVPNAPDLSLEPTPAEAVALQAIANGQPIRFDRRGPKPERTLRGPVLRAILTEAREDWPPAYPRLVIENAIISETLSLVHVRRRTARDAAVVSFEAVSCVFENAPDISDGHIESLLLRKCRMPGLLAERVQVTGDLSLEGSVVNGDIRLERVRIAGDLTLSSSRIRGAVKLARARLAGALHGRDAKIRGETDMPWLEAADVDFAAATLRGLTQLSICRIHGNLNLSGAQLGDPKRGLIALNMNGGRVSGDLFMKSWPVGKLRQRFVSHGMIQAIGATISGGVEVHDAKLSRGVEAYALDLARLDTDGCVFLRERGHHRLEVNGAIDLSGARIDGYVRICKADLSPTDKPDAEHAHGVCLDLMGTRIAGYLEMHELTSPPDANGARTRPKGRYRFDGAHAAALMDSPESAWPERGKLEITNFTYDLIAVPEGTEARKLRLAWPLLQYSDPPTSQEFAPQPFERLALVLRATGFGQEADEIAILKRRMRLECRVDRPMNRLLSRFIDMTSRHGYSPFRALAWTTGYWLLGAVALTVALFQGWGVMQPSGDGPAETVRLVAWFGQPWESDHTMKGCAQAVPPLYALEMLIPGLHIGQADACLLKSDGLHGGVFNTLRTIYQIGGVIMTGVLVTTLTGILRRD